VSWLSAGARRGALALARAALPPSGRFAGADELTLSRLETMLGETPGLQRAFVAGLTTIDAAARVRAGRRFEALPLGAQLDLLSTLGATEGAHLVLRGVLTALKAAYFDDAALLRELGCSSRVEQAPRAERARWLEQVVDAATLGEDELRCDVVVVGTGAGGAPLAHSLAARGHAVLMVEEGQHFTRADFTGRPVEMMRKLYRDGGTTVALGNTAIPIPIGMGVGGTTLINSGTCFRVPEGVLSGWRAEGLSDFSSASLAPYFDEVERVLGVGPSTRQALGRTAEVIARGADALGWSHHPLARNAPGCDGQGLCCFGCPTDAKRSTNVSWVPMALERGANLVTGLAIDRVLVERDRAVGVSGVHAGRRVTIRASVVVLACGALLTPVLLERNGLGRLSGQLGRNLSIHPASFAVGVFDDEIAGWRSVPQGYAIDQFASEGLYFEGAAVPLDLTAMSMTGFGPSFMSLMDRFTNLLTFGFMVKDRSRGRVTAGANGKPQLRYWLGEHDRAQVQRGFGLLARVYFAAGASEVHLPVLHHERLKSLADVERFERAHVAARHVDLTAYHPLGTARMGVDPLRSVVNQEHELHDLPNLFVSDGSVMPSSLGVNPQVTIMAMALRAAGAIDQRLERLHRRAA
jgi:hypothetical protein